MEPYCDDELPDYRLKSELDVSELRAGLPQEFEVDLDDTPFLGNDDGFNKNDAYKYYEQDFLNGNDDEDEEEEEDEDGEGGGRRSQTQFEKVARKMTNVTEDGGVKKQIVSQGIGELCPSDANVTIHYNAYLEYADEPFDSTYLRGKPHHFNIGKGNVIAGIDIAVRSMRKKEKSRFLIQPDYAFGPRGCPPRIPGNATCLYVIELVNYADAGGVEAFYCLSKEEQLEAPLEDILKVVNDQRRRGKESFQTKKFRDSLRFYERAVKYLEGYHLKDEEEEKLVHKNLLQCYSNVAITSLKLNKPHQVIKNSNLALHIDPKFAKAHYLKGKALRMLGNFDPALTELREAQRLMPGNCDITTEMKLLEKQQQSFNQLERESCRRMFASSSSTASVGSTTASAFQSSSAMAAISAEFKEIVMTTLIAFKNDSGAEECPFSTNMITAEELTAVEEMARGLGLYVTPRKRQDNNEHIRICKKKPEL